MASAVNYVWNYCNEANQISWSKFGKPLSYYDLHDLTKGCSKIIDLNSQTIQRICHEYTLRAKQFGKRKLSWRGVKRSFGWIPWCYQTIKIEKDCFSFNGAVFRFWQSRPIDGKIKSGSINQDSRGRWYINITIEKEPEKRIPTNKLIGIDLGLNPKNS